MPRHQAAPIRRDPGCLWAKAGCRLGTFPTTSDSASFSAFDWPRRRHVRRLVRAPALGGWGP